MTEKQIYELQNIMSMDLSSNEYQKNLDTFLETLPIETTYLVLKLLQNMLNNLIIKNEKQIELSKSLRNDAENLINNAQNIKELKKIEQNLKKQNEFYMCPVYGQISAGQPNWAEENIEGRIPIDTDLMDIYNPEEYFFLRVNGESMNKIVKNGAFALIHKQDIVENGEIAVILVNGYDATLKKFTRHGELIILEPNSTDESFETQVYDKTTTIKILGKYVGKMEINK